MWPATDKTQKQSHEMLEGTVKYRKQKLSNVMCGYGRRVEIKRSWVRIPALDEHFFTSVCPVKTNN